MKLFDSAKRKNEKKKKKKKKKKKGENVPTLETVEVMLVQCNLVNNQHQQKSKVLCPFTPNKSYDYLLNAQASSLVFLKIYNTEFDEIVITDLTY